MYQMTAHNHISGGQGGKSHMTPRYMANVSGKERAARTNFTLGL